jgi:hypothetical protein
MTQEKFDLNAWQAEGQEALDRLKQQRSELLSDLQGLDDQIKKIEETLGHTSKKRRVRIRPRILDIVTQNPGSWIAVDTVVHTIKNDQPDAEESAIRTAITRAARDIQNLEEREGELRFSIVE